jgi:hypothetical protein
VSRAAAVRKAVESYEEEIVALMTTHSRALTILRFLGGPQASP